MNGKEGENMSYTFTDYSQMVGKKPRQTYWLELQDAVIGLDKRVASEFINVLEYKPATDSIYEYPQGITSFEVTEDVETGYPSMDGIVETVHISDFRNIQHFFAFTEDDSAGSIYHRQWKPSRNEWTPWVRLLTNADVDGHFNNTDIHLVSGDRERIEGYSHYQPVVSNRWVIVHNMNKYPSVTIVDSGSNVMIGDVSYTSRNEVIVSFTAAFAGTAHLN
jgi:hypothetical protein